MSERNYGVPDETLQDKVRFRFAFDATKHGLAHDPQGYADEQINRMTNAEFLQELSEAIEEMKCPRK